MVKKLIVGDATYELATTRRILERLPEEHMSWKPHEKSMTLGGLATHLINLFFKTRFFSIEIKLNRFEKIEILIFKI